MSLWLYEFVSRAKWLSYRGKIMLMAFVGTHVPLLAIIAYSVLRDSTDLRSAIPTLAVALAATLAGTGITLFVLDQLLRPILLTSRGLRRYREARVLPDLPEGFADEAGTLMADAASTLKDLDRAVDELAHFDKLTGLPNRTALLAEIGARVATDEPFAVCAFRLDGYERLVATFDQATADRVLSHLANAFRIFASDRRYLARVEGGLFALVLPTDGDVERIVRGIGDALATAGAEITVGDVRVTPRLAAGVALSPADGTDPERLLDSAISAFATSAAPGVAPVSFFSPVARDIARARFLTEQELRQALVNDEFRLHYQPVIDTRAGKVIGGEALIRWEHPTRGLVAPAAFIPIAESSGLIDPIGRWVLGEACAELKRLDAAGRADLRVAVNLSAKQFHDPSLHGLIAEVLVEHAVDSARLELELTETAAMDDTGRTARVLGELRKLGLSIAIDDFGTGYASISNLIDLPFDRLKIDRKFVSGIGDARQARAICAAVLALADGLGAEVLAEGVETEDELRLLREMGCRQFQGFYFARPMPAADFLRFANDLRLTADLMAPEKSPDAAARKPQRRSA